MTSEDTKRLISEARRRASPELGNISYPSRASAQAMRDLVNQLADALQSAEASLSQLQADATLTADMNVRNVLFRKGTLLSAVESVLTGWYDEITAARNPQADAGGERLRAALEKIEEIAKNCGPDSGVREGTFGDGVAAGLRQAADVASLALSGGK